MRALRRTWKRLTGTFRGSGSESQLADELESHLQLHTEDNIRQGMSPADARRAAVLHLGGIEAVKESYRDQRGLPHLSAFLQDLRYAFRSMRRSPEFAVAAILSLALGIGATTAIFSVADAVLLRSLPYSQPQRLVTISVDGAITAPLAVQFRREAHSIESAALFTNWYFNLAGQNEPERIPAARVSASLFSLLGVTPQLGRAFTPDEDQKDHANVVLIGDAIWRRRFAADPSILGRTLILNDTAYTVVGVMPPGFRFPEGPEHHATVGAFAPAEMWRPMALLDWERTCKGCFNFGMLARLRPGFTAREAATELTAVLNRAYPKPLPGSPSVTVLNIQDAVTSKVRLPITILLGAVTLALLIACVNVANLLLARVLRRRGEIAIRISLGATRARIAQQAFTEAVALVLVAAAFALPVAWAAIRGLIAIAPPGIPRLDSAGINPRMFGFALLLAFATALLLAVGPAALMARRAPGDAMRIGGRTNTAAPSRLRGLLMVAEFALSLVLLVGSGLLAKSFLTVSEIPLGFRAENVLTMRVSLPATRYTDRRRSILIDRLISSCLALPGVTAAAATSTLPLTGEAEGWGLAAEDSPNPADYTMMRARAVTPGYFRTFGIRLRAGRDFNASDRPEQPVAIVSESAARRLWPGVADPIGRRILDRPPMTVVGIVDDTHASGVDAEIRPYLYVPFSQFSPSDFAVAVRSTTNPESLIKPVKTEIWRIDKDQPVTHVVTMRQLVADAVAARRFEAILMTLFAAFALILAAIGIYGVLSYAVAQRTREIGICMALGASRRSVVGGILRQAGVLAGAGAILGLAAAFALTPLLRSLLYGVTPTDRSIFVACALLLLGVAALAAILPARRAAKLDPIICLRYE